MSLMLFPLQVSAAYRKLHGFSQGQAVTAFMEKIQCQPRYGVHYFNVKVSCHLNPESEQRPCLFL